MKILYIVRCERCQYTATWNVTEWRYGVIEERAYGGRGNAHRVSDAAADQQSRIQAMPSNSHSH